MVISYDYGHGTGQDRGAEGFLNEENCIRQYAPYTINALMRAGYKCVNCTPTQAGMSLQGSLSYRTNTANSSGSSLHLCFHVNAGGGQGTEIEIAPNASSTSARVAESVLSQIVSLGFNNRGIKNPRLWVTDYTNMPCILIEPFFCDTQSDCNRYNAEALGNAIAKGVISAMGGIFSPSNMADRNFVDVSNCHGFVPNGSIRQLQTIIGATSDGIVGNETLSKCPMLSLGSSGNLVKWLQYALNSIDKAGLVMDGQFGNGTKLAVMRYQTIEGLSADGIVGKGTWSKILRLS